MWVLSFVYTLFIPDKIKTAENQMINSRFTYPDPGSNRDGLPHWCLRPARLPIPPSGHTLYRDCGCKDRENFLLRKKFSPLFSFYFSRPAPPTLRVGASAPLRRNLLRKKFSPLFSFYFFTACAANAARWCLRSASAEFAPQKILPIIFILFFTACARPSAAGCPSLSYPPRGGVRCTPVIV